MTDPPTASFRAGRANAVLVVTGFASFVSAQDSSATLLVIPLVQQDLATTVTAAQWIVLAYLLTVTGLLLPSGRLGDLLGFRLVFLGGILLFGISSVMCALAPATSYLIAFRVLEAVGAAMKTATAPALVTWSFPAAKRGRVLGLQLTMTYLGLTVGPFFGGFVADWWSWRGIFWLNGLLSLILLYCGFRVLPDVTERTSGRFDFRGAATLITAVLLLMIGVTRAIDWSAVSEQGTLLRLCGIGVALVLGWIFIRREKRLEAARMEPLLSPGLFATRPFALSATVALSGYMGEFFVAFLMPFYLIQIMGLSPSQAGLLFMVKSAVMMVVAPLAGRLSDRIGPRLPSIGSMACYMGAFALQARLPEVAGWPVLVAIFVLTGVAAGLFVSPNNSTMIGSAPPQMRGMAAAVIGLVRNFGMVFGTAFSGALLALRPADLLGGFHLAMTVGALIALGGLILGALQGSEES